MKFNYLLALALLCSATSAVADIAPLFKQQPSFSALEVCPGKPITLSWALNPEVAKSVKVTLINKGETIASSNAMTGSLVIPADALRDRQFSYSFDLEFTDPWYAGRYGDHYSFEARQLIYKVIAPDLELERAVRTDCDGEHAVSAATETRWDFVDADARISQVRTQPERVGDRVVIVEHAGVTATLQPGIPSDAFKGLPVAGVWKMTSPLKVGEICGKPETMKNLTLPLFRAMDVKFTASCSN